MSSVPPATLVLLPGLGTDARVFESQSAAFPDLVVPTWPTPQMGDTLEAYAQRCAETWFPSEEQSKVGQPVPIVLGGFSMVGPLAIEIALQCQARGISIACVLLISSCRSRGDIPGRFRWQQWWMERLPSKLQPWLLESWIVPRRIRREKLTGRQAQLLRSMAKETDWDFLRWAASACAQWRRSRIQVDASGLKIHQIHGRLDDCIPAPPVDDATILLQGRHMTVMQQAEEVNRWIAAIVREEQLRREHRPV